MATLEERTEETTMEELAHKTKIISFLGRTTPIILQNDNGPCPLLAICNVLLLKNNLNLSSDVAEVTQEKLLSLVAERLIDSNSNVDDKDAGYVENQQQNISDAIDLLPRLTTGIDVNIKFTRIDDFEFTRECAIFDLLDIPLYHGWIVDPQDHETADAIGLKSYNTLMGELVALETRNMEIEQNKNIEEDSVDFAAATTAALGVPSPSLSRGMSFEESPKAVSEKDMAKKGDVEEELELLKAIKLSEPNPPILVNDLISFTEPTESTEPTEQVPKEGEKEISDSANEIITPEVTQKEGVIFDSEKINDLQQSTSQDCGENVNPSIIIEKNIDVLVVNENVPPESSKQNPSFCENNLLENTGGVEVVKSPTFVPTSNNQEAITDDSNLDRMDGDADSSSVRKQDGILPEVFVSRADENEPMYEGEECVLESELKISEIQEPMYEGEAALAEQVENNTEDSNETSSKDQFSPKQGELIRNFLKNSASQLTINGLFCLQDGLKERELCVFFRNNHFNTMFKFEGELYILATDQGYLNQPDLVWEKLNEVNGNTVFMTSTFKEFNAETQENTSWDERNAVASTTDFIASIDNAANSGSSFNSDLQLAIALQQQEFEQQQQQRNVQQQQQQQQQPVTTNSRLVVGPQGPRQSGRNASVSARQESKSSKEKCNIM